MNPYPRVSVALVARNATASMRDLTSELVDTLRGPVYDQALDAAGVQAIVLHLGDSHDHPRCHRSGPGVFEIRCALEWTAVLAQSKPAQHYVLTALVHTLLGQVPTLQSTVWPAGAPPDDADTETLDAIVSVATQTHLSPEERQQLILFPTADKVQLHLDEHPAAAARVQTLSTDRDAMAVDVFWAGARFDSHTEQVFDRISRATGVPIRLGTVLLTCDELWTVHDRIFAEQDDVQTVGNDVRTDTIEVGIHGSLDGRPPTIEHNGKTVPIRYHYSDVQPLPGPADVS